MSKEITTKEQLIEYILAELEKKIAPVDFGDFFMQIGPSFGIDNFRNLLDELCQQGYLTKLEQPGRIVPSLGIRTLDLRYDISLKGIEYLKQINNNMDSNPPKDMIDVFVTYSWESEEHNEKIIAFTNFLRDNGFNAKMDKMIIQEETAKDFKVMMHKAMTDYRKVVVVLSSGYKEKAEQFKGGVGNEYTLILKDIEENPNKYILVSFEGHKKEIVPLFFKDREIINLSENSEEEKRKLFAKLLDKKLYQFVEVADKLPEITSKVTPSLFSEKEDVLDEIKLNISSGSASYFAKRLKNIDIDLSLSFKNISQNTLTEYSIEVYYPKNTLSFEVDGRIEDEYKIVTIDETTRLFSQQTKSINLEKLILRSYNITQLIDKEIIIKIYTDFGVYQKHFPLNEFNINDFDGRETKLSIDLFNLSDY
jgi:hypothetical protein